MAKGKVTVQQIAREQVKLGVSRSAAVAALVQRGVPQSEARVAVDVAIERSASGWLPAGAPLVLAGVGILGLGVLLSLLIGNIIFIGLIVVGLITIVRGLLGGSSGG